MRGEVWVRRRTQSTMHEFAEDIAFGLPLMHSVLRRDLHHSSKCCEISKTWNETERAHTHTFRIGVCLYPNAWNMNIH